MDHIMLDIETMGTESLACIASIGAVKFNIETGETGEEFHMNIDMQSSIDVGLRVNGSTISWWLQQSKEAVDSLIEDPKHITEVLTSFSEFCTNEYQVWGNSARFDCGILEDAYSACNMSIPWDFRMERCVRTLVSFNPQIKSDHKGVGVKHNPIDDCKFQIGYCSKIWNTLNK